MTHRKSAFELTAAEQNRFLQVITAMNSDNDPTLYAQFVGIHADMRHRMHTGMGGGAVGRQRFLPWHRDFLLKDAPCRSRSHLQHLAGRSGESGEKTGVVAEECHPRSLGPRYSEHWCFHHHPGI
jgi:hypothetical protein